MKLSHAIDGYLLEAEAAQLSSHTLADYRGTFAKFTAWLDDDPEIGAITKPTVQRFLSALGTDPSLRGGTHPSDRPLSRKSVLNTHIGLSALWTWALAEGLVDEHIVRQVQKPKPEIRAIDPFTEADVRALLAATARSAAYTRPGKRECTHGRATALRDVAIILLLLDTGMRASELCDLRLHDIDLKQRKVKVFGKGSKERMLAISARTGKALWKYLANRPDARLDEPLILSADGRPYNRGALGILLRSLGEQAGVVNCHPHRFRHTFAIQFLRNGGDAYTLQMLLGHASMDMVRRYIALAQADLDRAHAQASPVSNWHL